MVFEVYVIPAHAEDEDYEPVSTHASELIALAEAERVRETADRAATVEVWTDDGRHVATYGRTR
jgi:hypothetical protein